MRRSFGPGMGGGGGGGGGGGMIKTVHRAVRAGIGGGGSTPEPYSHAATVTRTTTNRNQPINTTLSLSSNTNPAASPCSNYLNHPVPPTNWAFTTAPVAGEEFDWEYVDGDQSTDGDSVVNGFYDDLVFGTVPSQQEVHHAISSLQEVLEPVSFAQLIKNRETCRTDDNGAEKISSSASFYKLGSELDWIEPPLQLCNTSSALQVPTSGKVYEAFHLLQTEPSVQRMVISLSSDKAVWDAVMNNEVVRELRESVIEDKSVADGPNDEASNPVTQVLRWMFVNTKERVIEIVEKITKMVNELVQPMNKDQKKNKDMNHVGLGLFEDKLRSSFFLSIMVLLIVVVSRSRKC